MVTFVQESHVTNAVNGTTFAAHASAQVGDTQIIAIETIYQASPAISGWTQTQQTTNGVGRLTVFTRTVTAGNVASTVPCTWSDYGGAIFRTYRGASYVWSPSTGNGYVSGQIVPVPTSAMVLRIQGESHSNTSGSQGSSTTLTPDAALINSSGPCSYIWYGGITAGDDPTPPGSNAPSRTATGSGTTLYPQYADYIIDVNPPPVPNAPAAPTVIPLQTSAVVYWTRPFGYLVDAYEYRIDGGTAVAAGTASITRDGSPALGVTVSGFTVDTTHTIEVRAHNSGGFSAWSPAVTFTTRTTYLYDDFERADSATTAGSPVAGGPYTVVSGTFGTTSGMLYNPGGAVENVLTFPSANDVDIRVEINAQDPNPGVIVRYVDASNFWLLQWPTNTVSIYRKNAGTFQVWKQLNNVPWAAGDIARVVAYGTTFYVYRNGSLLVSMSDPGFYDNTKTVSGIRMQTNTANRFRNLIVAKPNDAEFAAKNGQVTTVTSLNVGKEAGSLAAYGPYAFNEQPVLVYKGRDTKTADAGSVA